MLQGFLYFISLQQMSHDYFTAVVLFCDEVSCTVWSIGHLVPVHTQWMFDKYGTGLGINTLKATWLWPKYYVEDWDGSQSRRNERNTLKD